MNRSMGDWVWRATMLLLLAWVGTELHNMRRELSMTVEAEQETATSLGRTPGVEGCEDHSLQVRGRPQVGPHPYRQQQQAQPAAATGRAAPAV